ncbi:MAG TPA: tRNA epoxyqueuosine(34) reductase QueG [Fimbriimonadaceae bacterium]|nr:tRNA epoxyqueuosine(34) reductase QueG [Fimbriimonadaceae bacterium]
MNAADLKNAALEVGFDRVGICRPEPPASIEFYAAWLGKGYAGEMTYLERSLPLRADPRALLPEVRSVLAVGMNYRRSASPQPGQPRIASYALGRDYHKVLRARLRQLARRLPPGTRSKICVDSTPILEREYAHRAGLGWFGKNTCLIDPHRGSWFFIGLMLTDLELAPDRPSLGGCGTCDACVSACPTGAIVLEDDVWQVDARRCISYLTIEHRGEIAPDLRRGIGDWTFGCDVCQDVCPFNRPRPHQPERAAETEVEDLRRDREWPSLIQLAQIPHEDWDRLTQGSAVRRAGYEGLRRNARMNLENAAETDAGTG